jgi:uncharacterized protein (DUF983 family)
MRRELNDNEEMYGNNAAFCCPKCGKIYLVSSHLNKNGRLCPKCGKSKAHIEDGSAYIETE